MANNQQTLVGVGCPFSTIGAAVDAGHFNLLVISDTTEDATIVVSDNLKIFIEDSVNVTFTEKYAFIISGILSSLTIRGSCTNTTDSTSGSTITLSKDCLMISPICEDNKGFVYLTNFRLVGCGNNIITGVNTTIKNVTFCDADWFDLSSLGTKLNVWYSIFKVKVTLVCADNDTSVIKGNVFESWVITDGATNMTFDSNFSTTQMVNAGTTKNCIFSSNRFDNLGMICNNIHDTALVGNIVGNKFEGGSIVFNKSNDVHDGINRIPREKFTGGKNIKKAR
uniref:Uncharacterized protein n=1 Tax=Marseillevirus LCMAC101 TaxID=2506602 RepID=A0A481YRH0_9VIRU|nr:MAG: hypothetical protein LCMAC101_04580 [Marseillevirus LCMAC101]